MRRAGRLFDAICERDNFKLAWLKAARGKAGNAEVLGFRNGFDAKLERLRSSFAAGEFEFGRYKYFKISDPKERLISAASFPERIAHHAIMNVLDPVFERCQICDSYACRVGKGTRAAVLRAFHVAKRGGFFLKMDVRKYFDSIDHRRLLVSLERLIKDARVLAVLGRIIDSYETSPGKGIPIGNLTSQYFANHYLAALDHRAKERLGARHWIRYMDDILACSDRRAMLDGLFESCVAFCREELSLELKPKIVGDLCDGAPFLGFVVKPGGIYLSARRKRRFRRKAMSIEHELSAGRMSELEAGARIEAMTAHCLVARARGFRYAVFHGGVLGRQPRESRRQLEQRREESAVGESEQQRPRQPQQQPRFPSCLSPLARSATESRTEPDGSGPRDGRG